MTTDAGKKNIFWVLVQISFYNFFSECMHVFTPFSSHPKPRLREELIKSPFSDYPIQLLTMSTLPPAPSPPISWHSGHQGSWCSARRKNADYHKSADIARGSQSADYTGDKWRSSGTQPGVPGVGLRRRCPSPGRGFKRGQMSGRTRGHKPEEENEEDREDAVSPAFSYFSVSSSPSQAAPESPPSSRQASL